MRVVMLSSAWILLPMVAHGFTCEAGWKDDFCPSTKANLSGCASNGYSMLPPKPDWLHIRSQLIQTMFGSRKLPQTTEPSNLSSFIVQHQFPNCLYSVWGDGKKEACEKPINVTELTWSMVAPINQSYNLTLHSKVYLTFNTSGYAPNYWIDSAEQPPAVVLPKQGRTLVVFHNGHGTSHGCPTYGDTDGIADYFNQMGFDVAMVMMPFHDCNYKPPPFPNDHAWFRQFADRGVPWVRFFIEPAINTINYAKEVMGYENIVMMGLSGGGWTTTLVAALDPRITLSMPVAGSVPCDFRHTSWDYEQFCDDDWARVGNYTALYVLAALEPGRTSVQMLHEADPCCFHACGRHGRILDYNQYVRANTKGQFRTVVTEGNLHQVNLRERSIAGFLIEKVHRGQTISASDTESPFSILGQDIESQSIIV